MAEDELLPYYESELTFLRQMGARYSEDHPGIAAALKLKRDTAEDPHVERLIESFALLAARVQHKLDQEYPEITSSLLETLYPHYLRPVPAMAVVQFALDPSQSRVTSGIDIPKGTPVLTHPDKDGRFPSFRTCYPVKLWPVSVTGADLAAVSSLKGASHPDAAYAIRITLRSSEGVPFAKLPLTGLRFHLSGQGGYIHSLYEWLFTLAVGVGVRAGDSQRLVLPPSSISTVGFGSDEGILPYSDRSFTGYRLIQEYFHFPEKFLFFDVTGLSTIDAGAGNEIELAILLREPSDPDAIGRVRQAISPETFQLGCSPIVNLFERNAEPVRLSHTKSEHKVVGDQHRQSTTEIYSVDEVVSVSSYGGESRVFAPFYSFRHAYGSNDGDCFWISRRRPSRLYENSTEVYLSLVDLDFNPALPPVERLTARVTCTNRDLSTRVEHQNRYGELQTEGLPGVRSRLVGRISEPAPPPLGGSLQWRLISHLSLNHLSIVEGGGESLRSILRLYDFTGRPELVDQINGILDVRSETGVSRILSPAGVAFCRGTDVTIDFDESQFTGAGVFLMAAVLERFLGLYAAVNSYTRLTARTRKGVLRQWAPRTGQKILL